MLSDDQKRQQYDMYRKGGFGAGGLTSEDLAILAIFSEECLEAGFELEDRGRGNQRKGRIWRSILRLLLKSPIFESKRKLPIRER